MLIIVKHAVTLIEEREEGVLPSYELERKWVRLSGIDPGCRGRAFGSAISSCMDTDRCGQYIKLIDVTSLSVGRQPRINYTFKNLPLKLLTVSNCFEIHGESIFREGEENFAIWRLLPRPIKI